MKEIMKRLLLALGIFSFEVSSEHPVCIIGAGPAGLATAAELEMRGKRTITFEKQEFVGGKCQAVYQDGGFSPLGAFIFTPPTYRETIKIVVQTGMTSVPFISGGKYQYNTSSGDIWPKPAPPAGFLPLFMQEIGRYIDWWNKNFYLYNAAANYGHGISEEFTISTAAWLARNNYKVIQVLFIQAMFAYGYGDYREVPIIYMLQYLTPDVTMALLKVQQGQEIHIADFHEVLSRYAEMSIAGPIHLHTSVEKVDRSGNYPVVTYQHLNDSDRQTHTQSCSAVVLAFPPTVSALRFAGLDLDEDELRVFSPVGTNSFYSGAVKMKTPNAMTFGAASSHPMLPPDATGDPVVVVKLHENLDIAITNSWGPYRGNLTKEEAYSRLKTTLSKINKDPSNATSSAEPITDAEILAFQENDYFPHYDEKELAMGFYGMFEALQGKRNTYYASGFNKFELVEYAIRAGQDIARTFF